MRSVLGVSSKSPDFTEQGS